MLEAYMAQIAAIWDRRKTGVNKTGNGKKFTSAIAYVQDIDTNGNFIGLRFPVQELLDKMFAKEINIKNGCLDKTGLRLLSDVLILGRDVTVISLDEKLTYKIGSKVESEIIDYYKDNIEIADVKIAPEVVEAQSNKLYDMQFEGEEVNLSDISTDVVDEMTEENEQMIGIPTCPKCHGRGWYAGDFGVKIKCSCVEEKQERIQKAKRVEEFSKISGVDNDMLVNLGIISPERKGDDFNRDRTQAFADNMLKMFKDCVCPDKQLNDYLTAMTKIIVELRAGQLPSHSYIFSSHAGFGKETFVNTCNRIAFERQFKVVPYISLMELNEKRLDYMDEIKDRKKLMNNSQYTWSSYVNADIVFVYMASSAPGQAFSRSELDDAVMTEFSVLDTLLSLRSKRNKPTIVMSNRRFLIYRKIKMLETTFMHDIYTDDERFASMDRLYEYAALFGVPKRK